MNTCKELCPLFNGQCLPEECDICKHSQKEIYETNIILRDEIQQWRLSNKALQKQNNQLQKESDILIKLLLEDIIILTNISSAFNKNNIKSNLNYFLLKTNDSNKRKNISAYQKKIKAIENFYKKDIRYII